MRTVSVLRRVMPAVDLLAALVPLCLIACFAGTVGAFDFAGPTGFSDYSHVNIKTENGSIISGSVPENHGQMNMVRHPDGSIYLNTHFEDPSQRLLRSTDNGQTWSAIPVGFPAPTDQADHVIPGFGISSDGKLWALHQGSINGLYVSTSSNGGASWSTTEVPYPDFSPGAPADPYTIASSRFAYSSFVEMPDGTMMFSTSVRYPDYADWLQADQTRPGVRDLMIRSSDSGLTWGDPTIVHQHATETDHAVDPNAPNHILSVSRKQRKLLPGEPPVPPEANPDPGVTFPYKGSLLLESNDGGQTFQEVPGSYNGFLSHRGAICWTDDNVIIFSHYSREGASNHNSVAQISPDGGQTWVDGSPGGTTTPNASSQFTLAVGTVKSTSIELSRNRFLTAYMQELEFVGGRWAPRSNLKGTFWRLRGLPDKSLAANAGFDDEDLGAAGPSRDSKSGVRGWQAGGDSGRSEWQTLDEQLYGGSNLASSIGQNDQGQLACARGVDSFVGETIWLFQSIGTVQAVDVDKPLQFSVDAGVRSQADNVAYSGEIRVSFRTGTSSVIVGALKGVAAGIVVENKLGSLAFLQETPEATYTPTSDDLGEEVFIVIEREHLSGVDRLDKNFWYLIDSVNLTPD